MILHVGVHSIIKNFDELREIITFAKTSPNVICTQETRLKYNIPFHYALQNYNFIHVNSLTNAGGVEMFIKSTILFYRAHFLRLFVTVKRFGFKSCYLIVIKAMTILPSRHLMTILTSTEFTINYHKKTISLLHFVNQSLSLPTRHFSTPLTKKITSPYL